MSAEREVRQSFLALEPKEAEARFVALGGRPFHARAARKELLERGVRAWSDMTSLPGRVRERLEEELPLLAGREVARSESRDGTVKLLIEFPRSGTGPGAVGATVETVHMPSTRADRGATLCVSTQAGCPIGCPFCASGLAGLARNLAAHEIVEQYLRGRELGALRRSVVMGIGEPLLNAENLVKALAMVHEGLGLGARKITVSTVGFPERVARVARWDPRCELAISLHTVDDEQRARLVPAMRDVPVEAVLDAGHDWFEVTGREPTWEVVLLGGENDSPEHARRLAERLGRRRGMINLIPYNPIAEGGFERPSAERVEAFRERLETCGRVATVRWSRGLESDAACGQLRLRRSAE